MMNRLILALFCCCLVASLATSSPYRGKPLSLDVRDADVRDLLRFLADFGEADLVLDESVKGRITIKLKNVPWDQAMELILKQSGYGIEIIGTQYVGDGITVVPRKAKSKRKAPAERAGSRG